MRQGSSSVTFRPGKSSMKTYQGRLLCVGRIQTAKDELRELWKVQSNLVGFLDDWRRA